MLANKPGVTRDRPKELRDRAILKLPATYGLRAGGSPVSSPCLRPPPDGKRFPAKGSGRPPRTQKYPNHSTLNSERLALNLQVC